MECPHQGVQELTGPYGMSHDVGEDTNDAKVRQLRDRALWEKQRCGPQAQSLTGS